MSDFDSHQEKTSPGRAAPNIAFGQAMTAVAARCSQIAISLDSQDLGQVAHVFRSAANLWLAGRSACRRLVGNDRDTTPDARAAMALLNESYVGLLELLARAYKVVEELDVRKVLDDVRLMLVTAMAEPLDETTDTDIDARDRR